MALINCSECGKEISDKAVACPNCGCPAELMVKIEKDPEVIKYEFIKKKLEDNNYFRAKTILECQRELQIPPEETQIIVDKLIQEHEKADKEHEANIKSKRLRAEWDEEQKAKNSPKCPTCGSTDIEKIGMMGKMLSTELFGLASSSMGKTFECNDCGYKW